jgi:hypothetical protein
VTQGPVGRAAGEGELSIHPFIHARPTGALASSGVDQLWLAASKGGQHAMGVYSVAAKVHQRPAGEIERPAGVTVGRRRCSGEGLDVPELPDLARGQDRVRAQHDRMEQVVEPLDRRNRIGGASRVPHLARLAGVGCEGLLAEHVFTGPDRREVPRPVQRVRQRVVDQLDVGGGDNVSVGVKHLLEPGPVREGCRPVAPPRGHRHQPIPGDPRRRGDGSLSDASRPQ